MKAFSSLYTILPVTLFALLILLPLKSYAGNNALAFPEELQGIWVLTSCDTPNTMIINTKFFNMHVEKAELNFLQPIISVKKREDFHVIKIGTNKTAFHTSKTGMLFQNLRPDDVMIGDSPADEWAQLNPDNHLSYVRCESGIEKQIDPQLTEILSTITVLDKFQDSCPILGKEQNIACHELLFGFFDQDKNGKLDTAELTRLNRISVYMFTHTFKGAHGVDEYDTEEHSSEKFIKSIMDIFDDDGSGSIDMEEVRNNWESFAKSQNGRGFMEGVDTLHQIIAIDSPNRPKEDTSCSPQQILEKKLASHNDAGIENTCTLPADEGFLQ